MRQHATGNTLTEYGMIAGLVLCVAYGGLKLLGQDVGQLISAPKLHTSQMQDYVNMQFNVSQSINVAGKNAMMTLNAKTGLPVIRISETAAHGTNATSIDGTVKNALKTNAFARRLDALASQITDPALSAWYGQVSRIAHLLAGAEGDNQGLSALQVKNVKSTGLYADGSSFRDIYNYQKELQRLLSQPPPGGNGEQIHMVSQLGVEIWNNAQPFTYAVAAFVKNDGTLDTQALAKSPIGKGMTSDTYDQIVSYNDLQTNISTVAADNSAAGIAGLQTTVDDAQQLQTP